MAASASCNNDATQFPLHVTIDVGPAVHQNAGLSRYAERLTQQLSRYHTEQLQLTLFYNRHSRHSLSEPLHSASLKSFPLNQYAWRLSVLASQILRLPYIPLARTVCASGPSRHAGFGPLRPIYHATEHLLPHLPCSTVLTVHDLIFEHYPQHHTLMNRLFLKIGMPLFVKAANAVIAVSRQTKQDLITRYRLPDHKIHVIYEGVDSEFKPAPAEEIVRVRNVYRLDHPYLLMVGTLEPRKNHALALHALARLVAQGYPHRLLICGGHGWLFEPVHRLIDELDLSDRVSFSGYVPARDLPPLYSGADCVLLPSLYEGFGFPALEAMACATPVVCSNASSLPEIAGDAALLVAPTDDEALTMAIRSVLDEPGLAQTLRERGVRRAAQFRWETCAAETIEVYRLAATL